MANLLIEHNVKDFKSWKAGFEAGAPLRSKHHITDAVVYQRHDNPNAVCIVCTGPSNDLQAFIQDPALKQAMKAAGVQGEPSLRIFDAKRATIPAI